MGRRTVFQAVFLFDRVKRLQTEYQTSERESAVGSRAALVSDRVTELTSAIGKLDDMVASIATTASQQREQIDAELLTYKAEAMEKWRRFSHQADEIEAKIEVSLASGTDQLARATEAAKTQVNSWLSAQDEQRQLEKPAELWAKRGREHEKNSRKWRNWSIAVAIGGLVLAVFIAVRAFQWSGPLFEAAMIPGTPASTKAAAGSLRPTFHYELIFTAATTLAWLTMYLWAMRLLVRLYTTEHHLAIDASARGAMMEAYLGLIEADAANAADRPIVLQALFRPVQDGMVRDDGPPGLTPAALLSALATSQGKGS
nr:hypothetical protein [uncultured organism]